MFLPTKGHKLLVLSICALVKLGWTEKVDDDECGMAPILREKGDGARPYPGEFPWAAYVKYLNSKKFRYTNKDFFQICTGSLVSKNLVISSAQCTDNTGGYRDFQSSPDNTKVIIGVVNANEKSSFRQEFFVKKFIKHPDYKHFYTGDDLVLIRLTSDVKWSERVRAICLPSGDKPLEVTSDPPVNYKLIGITETEPGAWTYQLSPLESFAFNLRSKEDCAKKNNLKICAANALITEDVKPSRTGDDSICGVRPGASLLISEPDKNILHIMWDGKKRGNLLRYELHGILARHWQGKCGGPTMNPYYEPIYDINTPKYLNWIRKEISNEL